MRKSTELELRTIGEREFPQTVQLLQSAVAEGVSPGIVAGIWDLKDPDRFYAAATGQRRIVPAPQSLDVETVFDLSSLTKVMGTTALAARLVDRGWLDWDVPLVGFFPSFPFPEIRLRHLLSHTAGFAAWEPFWERLREKFAPGHLEAVSINARQRAMREQVMRVSPVSKPGLRAVYSDLSFLWLGFLLEELTRMPLDEAIQKWVWEPMGLISARFYRVTRSPTRGRIDSVAATENCPWRGAVLQGQVHDDNCWAMGGYSGHAGAFANIRDVLHFARALFLGFHSRQTLRALWTRVSEPGGCERTLGWDTLSGPTPSAGSRFSSSSVGHLGFTGTSLWIDVEAGLAVSLLTNRVHPSRENNKIRAFRPVFHTTLRDEWARVDSSRRSGR